MKDCERTGCTRKTQRGYLFCANCWSLVEPKLKRRVWAAWRDFKRAKPGRLTIMWATYCKVRQEAIDAVNQHLEAIR